MRKRLANCLLLLFAIPALADQLVLKNGDKLTGTVTKSDGKTLVFKTDYAGDLTIKFDAIQSLTTAGDLNVTAGGKTAVGPVTTSGDQIVVATKTGGSVQEPLASVSILRSPAEEAAAAALAHALRHAGLSVDVGYSGNMGKRMKRADKIKAVAAVILGSDEVKAGTATIRHLDTGEQVTLPQSDVAHHLMGFK